MKFLFGTKLRTEISHHFIVMLAFPSLIMGVFILHSPDIMAQAKTKRCVAELTNGQKTSRTLPQGTKCNAFCKEMDGRYPNLGIRCFNEKNNRTILSRGPKQQPKPPAAKPPAPKPQFKTCIARLSNNKSMTNAGVPIGQSCNDYCNSTHRRNPTLGLTCINKRNGRTLFTKGPLQKPPAAKPPAPKPQFKTCIARLSNNKSMTNAGVPIGQSCNDYCNSTHRRNPTLGLTCINKLNGRTLFTKGPLQKPPAEQPPAQAARVQCKVEFSNKFIQQATITKGNQACKRFCDSRAQSRKDLGFTCTNLTLNKVVKTKADPAQSSPQPSAPTQAARVQCKVEFSNKFSQQATMTKGNQACKRFCDSRAQSRKDLGFTCTNLTLNKVVKTKAVPAQSSPQPSAPAQAARVQCKVEFSNKFSQQATMTKGNQACKRFCDSKANARSDLGFTCTNLTLNKVVKTKAVPAQSSPQPSAPAQAARVQCKVEFSNKFSARANLTKGKQACKRYCDGMARSRSKLGFTCTNLTLNKVIKTKAVPAQSSPQPSAPAQAARVQCKVEFSNKFSARANLTKGKQACKRYCDGMARSRSKLGFTCTNLTLGKVVKTKAVQKNAGKKKSKKVAELADSDKSTNMCVAKLSDGRKETREIEVGKSTCKKFCRQVARMEKNARVDLECRNKTKRKTVSRIPASKSSTQVAKDAEKGNKEQKNKPDKQASESKVAGSKAVKILADRLGNPQPFGQDDATVDFYYTLRLTKAAKSSFKGASFMSKQAKRVCDKAFPQNYQAARLVSVNPLKKKAGVKLKRGKAYRLSGQIKCVNVENRDFLVGKARKDLEKDRVTRLGQVGKITEIGFNSSNVRKSGQDDALVDVIWTFAVPDSKMEKFSKKFQMKLVRNRLRKACGQLFESFRTGDLISFKGAKKKKGMKLKGGSAWMLSATEKCTDVRNPKNLTIAQTNKNQKIKNIATGMAKVKRVTVLSIVPGQVRESGQNDAIIPVTLKLAIPKKQSSSFGRAKQSKTLASKAQVLCNEVFGSRHQGGRVNKLVKFSAAKGEKIRGGSAHNLKAEVKCRNVSQLSPALTARINDYLTNHREGGESQAKPGQDPTGFGNSGGRSRDIASAVSTPAPSRGQGATGNGPTNLFGDGIVETELPAPTSAGLSNDASGRVVGADGRPFSGRTRDGSYYNDGVQVDPRGYEPGELDNGIENTGKPAGDVVESHSPGSVSIDPSQGLDI